MATLKKGILTKPPEQWKHMRWFKPLLWRRERKAVKRAIARETTS